jgi:hypothetical protein
MSESVAPEFARFVAAERRALGAAAAAAARPVAEGDVVQPVFIEAGKAVEMLRVAARLAAGFFRPTQRTEIVWVDGENELAVNFAAIDAKLSDGLIRIAIPVRCDQIDAARIEVLFAVGSPEAPAGLYAAAPRRPQGPELVVAVWGDALVAFAWHCVLGLVAGIAGATGKDARGNLLVPVEMVVSNRGIEIHPMARHRFSGSSGLKPPTRK